MTIIIMTQPHHPGSVQGWKPLLSSAPPLHRRALQTDHNNDYQDKGSDGFLDDNHEWVLMTMIMMMT